MSSAWASSFGDSTPSSTMTLGSSAFAASIAAMARSNLVSSATADRTCPSVIVRSARGRPEVDAKREDPVLEGRRRVPDDGEVLVVALRLFDEQGPLVSAH